MRLLLDTHVMLWWLRDTPKLGPRARAAIAEATIQPLVSIASFWELSIKARKFGKGELGSGLVKDAAASGLEILGIRVGHLAALESLERIDGHGDPFDHLIMAQAISEGALLMTSDRDLMRYSVPIFR